MRLLPLIVIALALCGCDWLRPDPPKPVPLPEAHAAAIQAQFLWAILFGIFGIGVGVFILVALPFKRMGAAVASGSLAMIVCAMALTWVQDHIGWFMLGGGVLLALVLAYVAMRLKGAAAIAWDAMPEHIAIDPKAAKLLDKISPPDPV